MLYTKKALTVDEQINLLISKGLAANREPLEKSLTNVSYHRLDGYWHPYKLYNETRNSWCFREGTDFAAIWDRYVFDRQLRLLTFDAIERVEVAIRNDLILNVAVDQGSFGYLDPTTLPNIETSGDDGTILYNHDMLLGSVRGVVKRELRAENPAVTGFINDHPENGDYLPYWLLREVIDFGTLAHIIHGLSTKIKSKMARKYGLKRYSVLESWVDMLRITRNRCGHHARFWNRRNIMKPELPNKKNLEWHEPVELELVKDKAFITLTILKYLLGFIAPQSGWAGRLEMLFAQRPGIDRRLMGYPDNWKECPIWSDIE
jgi:abortive infection bacteriophage resistance protein